MNDFDITLLDLNDYEMPIFSTDREMNEGIPQLAKDFKEIINESDGILISFAEHNGSYSAAFKNIFDWMSRLEKPIWSNKPMFLMASSPGPRGGKNVLTTAVGSFPHQGAQVVAQFSLPSFNQNFEQGNGITDPQLLSEFKEQLEQFVRAV